MSDLAEDFDLGTPPPYWPDAACRDHPEANWFPSGRTSDERAKAELAAAICRDCAVRAACEAYALDQGPSLDGIWAGMSRHDRSAYRTVLRLRQRSPDGRVPGTDHQTALDSLRRILDLDPAAPRPDFEGDHHTALGALMQIVHGGPKS